MEGVDVIRYHIFVMGFAATGEQEVSNHDIKELNQITRKSMQT